jgi:CBS domain-containing protein
MKVNQAMTRDVCLATPNQSLRDAARMMAENDIGSLPVGDGDRLVGMITDRDIAVRAVAQGLGPDAKVSDAMSTEQVMYCFEDEDLEDVAANMGRIQVRRLPVLNRDKRLVGIVAVSDLAAHEAPRQTGEAMAGISAPGGAHSQTRH